MRPPGIWLAFLCLGLSLSISLTLSATEPSATTPKKATKPAPSHAFEQVIQEHTSSPRIGQGNPKVTKHPATREECRAKLKAAKIDYANPQYEKICQAKFMAPLYNPATEKPADAKACIDQFEYPNIPCEYPVVWVRANEAAAICQAIGKRLCDAHEWEGACAGALLPPDYPWELQPSSAKATVAAWRSQHNRKYAKSKTWAYGDKRQTGICAAASFKHKGCNGGDWQRCGSNTYPLGYFPQCKSSLDVYDQHGNAAEHMNLPLKKSQMASTGSQTLGYTEMKGSWFIFDKYKAHQDWCRWRAPFWHGTKVNSDHSHRNYHLGFRCCKTIK
jgi:formylglycine-generating enzyme required for sulfatase activity